MTGWSELPFLQYNLFTELGKLSAIQLSCTNHKYHYKGNFSKVPTYQFPPKAFRDLLHGTPGIPGWALTALQVP